MGRMLTVAEVAERLALSQTKVYRMVRSGELPVVRFGRACRVPEQFLDELVAPSATTHDGQAEVGT